jgi:hypothetical protein
MLGYVNCPSPIGLILPLAGHQLGALATRPAWPRLLGSPLVKHGMIRSVEPRSAFAIERGGRRSWDRRPNQGAYARWQWTRA